MSDIRDRGIDLEDLNEGKEEEDLYADFEDFIEVVPETGDLLSGMSGCFVHPDIPCMESCRAYNLYKNEDEPNCRIMMALEGMAESRDDRDIQVERNQILSKIEKNLAALLQQIQRMAT